MLYKETVAEKTFKLLLRLMQDEKLKNFNLVGGTALSLQMGHRISIDLDLFSSIPFVVEELRQHLFSKYVWKEERDNAFTLITKIEDIKVDFISYKFPLVNDLICEEGIRMYSLEDISAMKLSAIGNNGTRLKDFVDLACLSTKLSFYQMLEAFKNKFPNINNMHIIRSVGYHKDIKHIDIEMVDCKYDWDLTQERIFAMIQNPEKVFRNLPYLLKK